MSAVPTPNPALAQGAAAPRRRLSSSDRREQLLQNAIELFSQRGFSGTRTKDIAAACGVSEGILFRHFATKEDLYHAILESHTDEAGSREWLKQIKSLAAERNDEQLVRSMVRYLLTSFREHAAFHRLMLYAWLEGHALADMAQQQVGMPMFDFLRKYVAQRQKEGAFRKGSPEALVTAMFAPALQFGVHKYIFGVEWIHLSDESAEQEFAGIILAGLQRKK